MTEDELREGCGKDATRLIEQYQQAQREGRIFTEEQALDYPGMLPVACFTVPAVRGSVSKQCAVCDRRVWAPPSTQAVLRQRKGPSLIVCERCLPGRWAEIEKLLAASDAEMATGLMEPQPPQGRETGS